MVNARIWLAGLVIVNLGNASLAQQDNPISQAAVQKFSLLGPAGTMGHAETWTDPDGTIRWEESQSLGETTTHSELRIKTGAENLELTANVQSAQGKATESFMSKRGQYSWTSAVDSGSGVCLGSCFYLVNNGPVLAGAARLLEALLASPDHAIEVIPYGRVTAQKLADFPLESPRKKLSLWIISGAQISPMPIWSTDDNRFFAAIDLPTPIPAGFIPAVLPEGAEGLMPRLQEVQARALAKHSAGIAKSLGTDPRKTAFVNVRAFIDGKFVENQTVLTSGGKIQNFGPTANVKVSGFHVIDGKGMTLVPGLWDYHKHIEDDATGPLLLALGITSVRDPSSNNAATIDRSRRKQEGRLLFPNVYPSALIDGAGPNSTETRASWVNFGTVVRSRADALAAVQRAHDEGFRAIKLYGSINKAWVEDIAAEAHRLNLRLHGHLPSGWRPSDAIAAGYDEITHAYFVIMEAMPDEIVRTSETRNRFEGSSQYAKDIDLDTQPMKGLLAGMAEKGISADPTLVVVEWLLTAQSGALPQAYREYDDSAPPMLRRRFRIPSVSRFGSIEGRQKSFERLKEMVGKAHRAGVMIGAGTDGSGLELVRELEHYIDVGFSSAEALEAATIVPAKLLGVDDHTGSIAVGKDADLLLVEGDPSLNIGDLRNSRMVMLAGRLFDVGNLKNVSGFLVQR